MIVIKMKHSIRRFFAMTQAVFGAPVDALPFSGLLAAFFLWPVLACFAAEGESETVPTESRYKFYGWIESGITLDPDNPKDRQNFGRLFDDRSNEPLLNQAVLTFERGLLTGSTHFDWGFKLQAMVGSDARFTHSLGPLDNSFNQTVQPDILEAYLALHLPFFSAGGVDFKLGKFVTLEGNETIDPRANFFYSHTFLFNFGLPLNHTGALAIWHATPKVDLYAGITRGVNTSVDDNNGGPAFHGGFGLNLCDGNFTLLATTHIGPETIGNDDGLRFLNDVTFTVKITKKLTAITDLGYIYDDTADAAGFGIAQQFLYAFNEVFSLGIRGEVWRDRDGFFVASFAENDDVSDFLRGGNVTVDRRTVGGGQTTYGAVTAGVNIKVPVRKPLAGLVIRPEVRYDRSLNDTRPFNDSNDEDQFTAAIDVILSF